MNPPMDLRHRIEMVLQRTRELAQSLEDLPSREDAIKDAVWSLPPSMRAQLTRHLAELEPLLGKIQQSFVWLRGYLGKIE